jgi:hypothetical protein
VVQPGGVPKDTAALAAEVVRGCSDDFLRRTALELLGGVKPLMLQQKLLNVISGLGPEGLSKVNRRGATNYIRANRLNKDPYLSGGHQFHPFLLLK